MKARLLLPLAAVLAGLIVFVPGAFAQDGTGAQAFKDCPGETASPGDTITCNFLVANSGDVPATITELTETSPDPGGAPVDISCVGGGVTYDEGDVFPNGVPCLGSFVQTVPNDPALCGTSIRDRVTIALAYLPGPLTAGAFATHTTLIVCPADISITKTADALSKVGDSVTYTFVITNDGDGVATRTSVNDTLLGDITADFPATLNPGQSVTVTKTRVVQAGDADPLPNTVTAVYGSGASSDTATASASTNLFQPSIAITKNCAPDPVEVGQALLCTIVITNTSSNDTPTLQAAAIPDTRSGDLLVANPNVVSTTCGTGAFLFGGSCTIVTTHTVVAADLPGPIVNTVAVTTSPTGFPNLVSAQATDTVPIFVPPPPGGEGCTPGFWKQSQHFDSWTAPFDPTDSFNATFGVNVTLSSGGSSATLLQALQSGGGGINALARHAVAALLNAASPDVDSDFTTAQVIAIVQDAVAPGGLTIEEAHQLLAAANEQGCPLS